MSYKSHIQNTQSIFKGFVDEKTNKLYMLNLNTNNIYLMSPRKIGTQEEYYFEHNEKALNEIIESNFGKVLSKIRAFITKKEGNLILNNNESKAIIEFAFFLVLRSKKLLKEGKDNLYTKDLYNDQITHNHLIERSLVHAKNKTLPEELSNLVCNIVYNYTSEDFVTSRNGFCEVKFNKNNVVLIPIEPKAAIIIYEKTKEINNEVMFIDNVNIVNEINKIMYNYEIKYNNDFIASKRKETLTNILSII